MRIGVPLEIVPGESRVALIPDTAAKLAKAGFEVVVQAGAGERAGYADAAYATAGATLAPGARELFAQADLVLKVREPADSEIDLMREGAALVGMLALDRNPGLPARLAARKLTAFALERIPRTTRAQAMDVLSSMATIAGYRAALIAADALPRFFPMLMTAAGTIAPARVFVLGAGVAGLQAIATSRRLGGVVEAFDVRPAVREEVQSLGAMFVALDLVDAAHAGTDGYAKALTADQEAKERELIHIHVRTSDVVITTASVPGRRAPVLITEAMVRDMEHGSVIVDLAADSGGNCELTSPGAVIERHGVIIHGPLNLAGSMPRPASQMLSRNAGAFLLYVFKGGTMTLDFEDEITRGTCITHEGRVLIPGPDGATGDGSRPASEGPRPAQSAERVSA